jgi:hypothetical protein
VGEDEVAAAVAAIREEVETGAVPTLESILVCSAASALDLTSELTSTASARDLTRILTIDLTSRVAPCYHPFSKLLFLPAPPPSRVCEYSSVWVTRSLRSLPSGRFFMITRILTFDLIGALLLPLSSVPPSPISPSDG